MMPERNRPSCLYFFFLIKDGTENEHSHMLILVEEISVCLKDCPFKDQIKIKHDTKGDQAP